MNMWGFAPSFFGELASRFEVFLDRSTAADPLSSEFLLPDVVNDLVQQGKARVKVLPTGEKWFGVTYQADRPLVRRGDRSSDRRRAVPGRSVGRSEVLILRGGPASSMRKIIHLVFFWYIIALCRTGSCPFRSF